MGGGMGGMGGMGGGDHVTMRVPNTKVRHPSLRLRSWASQASLRPLLGGGSVITAE